MKALLVGAGGMGQTWARNLAASSRCRIGGWVDMREGAAAAAAKTLELGEIYTGTDLLKAIDDVGPDFVVDVTSPEGHFAVTTSVLAQGLPVLGEKPMAVTLDQARQMVEASEKAGKLYMVSQSRRYDPGLVALRGAIQGKLGSLGILNADFYIGAHFGGFRDEMESPLLLDMAIHTFDEARFLSDADPVSVLAEEFNPSWSWYQGDAAANASFLMSNGARFSYRGSWCAEGLPTSWDGDWRAVGEHGTASWLNNGEIKLDLPTGGGFIQASQISSQTPTPILSGIEGSLDEFLSALETGVTPQGECHDNIKSLAMVFAARESAKLGKRVKVEW